MILQDDGVEVVAEYHWMTNWKEHYKHKNIYFLTTTSKKLELPYFPEYKMR
jgi:hypothetical protein